MCRLCAILTLFASICVVETDTLESLCRTKRRRCTTEIVNLSGKRTEHYKCMFYSLEELIYINSFFAP